MTMLNTPSGPEAVPAAPWLARQFNGFLAPGRNLLLSLRLPTKLLLLSLTLLLPMSLLFIHAMQRGKADLDYVRTEVMATELAKATTPMLVSLQDLRQHFMLNDFPPAGPHAVAAEAQRMKAAIEGFDAAMAKADASGLPYRLDDLWLPLRSRLLPLSDAQHLERNLPSFADMSSLIEGLQTLVLMNAERSGLVLDPEARSYFLMDVMVNNLLTASEAASLAKAHGSVLMLSGESAVGRQAEVLGYTLQLHREVDKIRQKMGALVRAGGTPPVAWRSAQSHLTASVDFMRAAFVADALPTDVSRFEQLSEATVGSLLGLEQEVARALLAELHGRERRIQENLAWTSVAFAGGLLLLSYFVATLVGSFRASLRAIQQSVKALADGDFAGLRPVPGRDELADIGRTMDAMAAKLSKLVADIRNSASMVNVTGELVADGSSRLATRTEEQASSLRNSVVAIGQLSAAVDANAQAASQLDELTQNLFTEAQQGSDAMAQSVQAMGLLQEASQRVAHVVNVLDDIAFQTGMLSLNAAIEASRAGPAGKGFAVVATEVRELARQCAESAEEIRQLIAQSAGQVSQSSTSLGMASEALEQLVSGVKEVSCQLRTISTSTAQQSLGLQEVQHGVGNLNDITRENSALVEVSTTAANALLQRAKGLREAVVQVRLRQGSTDEAMAMVQRALEHVEAVGVEQALADFKREGGGFFDRDLYIFAFDRLGLCLALGRNLSVVGRTASQIPGLGASFGTRITALADAGGGWVDYEFIHPQTGEVMEKQSFVQACGGDLVLGCGVYRNQ